MRGRAPGPRQNQSENDGREISQGGPPCEISQAVPDASRAVPVLADLKFRDGTSEELPEPAPELSPDRRSKVPVEEEEKQEEQRGRR